MLNQFKNYLQSLQQRRRLKRWLADPDIKQCLDIYTEYYGDIDGTAMSLRIRETLEWQARGLVYGEINLLAFLEILERVKPQPGEIYYDLGSGIGNTVVAAALRYPLQRCCGIEILPEMIELSEQIAEKLRHLEPELVFRQQDVRDCDISDADIVFIHATCFLGPLWDVIVSKLQALKVGARVILISKRLDDDKFQLVDQRMQLMSWGMASTNVYCKVG